MSDFLVSKDAEGLLDIESLLGVDPKNKLPGINANISLGRWKYNDFVHDIGKQLQFFKPANLHSTLIEENKIVQKALLNKSKYWEYYEEMDIKLISYCFISNETKYIKFSLTKDLYLQKIDIISSIGNVPDFMILIDFGESYPILFNKCNIKSIKTKFINDIVQCIFILS